MTDENRAKAKTWAELGHQSQTQGFCHDLKIILSAFNLGYFWNVWFHKEQKT